MKIVLLGYMGSGKSAISKALSKSTGLQRIDLDDYIEEKEQLTIAEIFNQKGEIYFRKLETTSLKEILEKDEKYILSLGGGTPCFAGNMDLVNQHASSVYLSASIPTLVQRLTPESAKRPLIAHLTKEELPEFIGKHLFERRDYYKQATTEVAVDNKSVQEIATEILEKI